MDDVARARAALREGALRGRALRDALESLPLGERDAWIDRVLEIGEIPDDGPELPRGGVPYLPAGVDEILEAVDLATVTASDRVIDLGAGVGRLAVLVHALTGASVRGVEVQSALVRHAHERLGALGLRGVSIEQGDARTFAIEADVLVLYAPFSGPLLAEVLAHIASLAPAPRVVTIDLVLPTPFVHRAGEGRVRLYDRTP
jgi:2-polyprenyl-3-methyl-5-hydroxy-6-metoxy-1,4-benzoquinol methylase